MLFLPAGSKLCSGGFIPFAGYNKISPNGFNL